MIQYPDINPVAFHIFSWPVHWYGLMYLIGFLGGWAVLSLRLKRSPRDFTQDQLSDLVFYAAIGAIIGGRLGYVLFYDWARFASEPLLILQTWKGGMSFHGGLLGVLLGMLWCSYRMKKSFLALTDLIAPAVPIGLGAGRIGNFINGELWGRTTDVAWGMIFPMAGDAPRHPSQLYEFVLEGVVLFIIVWCYSRKPRPLGAVSGLFALCYGVFRFIVEFYRVPDTQIGYIAFGWFTQGQLLSVPLIVVGVLLMLCAYRRKGSNA
jgi:phosphatidylglycerol:prolipoprotein diacylglycerol transferase